MFMNDNKNTKKIVIIGGGLSSLITGNYLLKKGYKVTIIEKEASIGGKLSIYEHEYYPYIIYNKKELKQYLDELEIKYINENNYVHSIKVNENIKSININYNRFKEEIFDLSLNDDKEINNLFKIIKKYLDKNYNDSLLKKYENISIKDYLNKINSKQITDILGNILPSNLSMRSLIIYLSLYLSEEIEILNFNLISKLKEKYNYLGGKLLLNKKAIKFNFRRLNQVESVLLDDNTIINGDYFISSIDPKYTFENLLNKKIKDRRYYLRYEDYMNYILDKRIIIKFEIDRPFEYKYINVNINNEKVGCSYINNISIKKSLSDKFVYIEINQNYNDYDFLKLLCTNKKLYNEYIENLVNKIKQIFKSNFKEYKIEYKGILTPIDIENKYNCYRGYLTGYLQTPNSQTIITDEKIKGINNLFISSSIISSSGGIVNSIRVGKHAYEILEMEIKKNEKKEKNRHS